MKALLFKAALTVVCLGAYIGSPFYTAWSIREAVRNGDSSYLQDRIDWPGVRATLGPNIGRIALNLPDIESVPSEKLGMWQRFKAYVGQGAVNRALDSYVTPEGLPQLFAVRKAYRDYVAGQPDESKIALGERIKRAWARVKRAEFTSLTTFEIDMVDKHDPDRMFLGKLALDGLGWKLKELRIKMLTTAENAVVKFAETEANAVSSGFWDRAKAAAR